MEGDLYFREPFCRNMAWVDLLLLANHKPANMMVRGIVVKVRRGQVGYGSVSLAKRWKWSRSKVERFLKVLENEHQIEQQKTNITTLISIVNYDQYQLGEQQDDAADEQQTSINKNEKKEKKKQPLNKKGDLPPVFELVLPHGWDERFVTLWDGYRNYRIAERKGWYRSQKTEQQAVNGFWKDCNGDFDTAYKIMDNTMRNRWTGLFPLKTNNNGQGTLFSENGRSGSGKTTATIAGIANATDF